MIWLIGLLVIYCCTWQIIPTLSGLKQCPFIIPVSVDQNLHCVARCICLKVCYKTAKCCAELLSHLKVQLKRRRTHFQAYSLGCHQDSVPCGLWGSQFFAGYWLEAWLSSFPYGPLHRAISNRTAGSIKLSKWESEQDNASVLVVSEVIYHQVFCILVVGKE